MGVHGVKPLKYFDLFTSAGQINSLNRRNLVVGQCILKKNSMPKCLFLPKNFFMKIEFENSIRRLTFCAV